MALTMTLAQSKQLTTDTLQLGVIETLAKESKILAVLPFMNVAGSGYSYNVETQLADTQFRAVGDAITAQNIGIEKRTASLAILADEATIDTFQIAVHGNLQDLMALEVTLKAKAMAHKFEKTFLSGDTATDVKAFDGLDKLVTAGQTINYSDYKEKVDGVEVMGIAKALDELSDKILGTPNAYIMNKKTRREFTANFRKYITYSTNEFGQQITRYGDIDILDVEDEILADEYTIYSLRMAPQDGVCGLQNGGIRVTPIGQMESAPQVKTRIEWFVGLAVFSDLALAKATATVTPKP